MDMNQMQAEFRYLSEDVAGGKVMAVLAVSLRRENGRLIPTVHFYESEPAVGDICPLHDWMRELGARLHIAYSKPAPSAGKPETASLEVKPCDIDGALMLGANGTYAAIVDGKVVSGKRKPASGEVHP